MAKGKLKKELGLFDILMFGIGGIVGAGIYAIIGEAAGVGGNMLWLSFVIAAIVALLTGLTYAEFVSRFPDAGGSFEYVKRGLGETTALAFSIIMLLTGLVSAATIGISFSGYLSQLLEVPQWITTIGIIALMGLVNAVGAQEASWFNLLATAVTLFGLGAVIYFSAEDWGSTPLWSSAEERDYTGILAGSALIFFSYIGFEDLVKMAEETKNPEYVMPRGILISGVVVLVLYVAIAISAVSVISADKLAEVDGPLATVIEQKAGSTWVTIIVAVALFATSKTILSNLIGTSRLLYDVARDTGIGWLKRLTHVNATTDTPIPAIILITGIAIAFSLIGDLKTVASISNICIIVVFLAVNTALIVYRHRHPDEADAAFRVPGNVNNIPIPTILALLGVLLLLGFNIYNLTTG